MYNETRRSHHSFSPLSSRWLPLPARSVCPSRSSETPPACSWEPRNNYYEEKESHLRLQPLLLTVSSLRIQLRDDGADQRKKRGRCATPLLSFFCQSFNRCQFSALEFGVSNSLAGKSISVMFSLVPCNIILVTFLQVIYFLRCAPDFTYLILWHFLKSKCYSIKSQDVYTTPYINDSPSTPTLVPQVIANLP